MFGNRGRSSTLYNNVRSLSHRPSSNPRRKDHHFLTEFRSSNLANTMFGTQSDHAEKTTMQGVESLD